MKSRLTIVRPKGDELVIGPSHVHPQADGRRRA
jgi:hypothetical protein